MVGRSAPLCTCDVRHNAKTKACAVSQRRAIGEQNHWELNVAPIALRWQRFPWDEFVHTTAAYSF